jgi:hypothetical protein
VKGEISFVQNQECSKIINCKLFKAKAIFGFLYNVPDNFISNIICIDYPVKSVLEKICWNNNEEN